jgi:hypothetical protein
MSFHILGIIIPTDFHIQRGGSTTNQIIIPIKAMPLGWYPLSEKPTQIPWWVTIKYHQRTILSWRYFITFLLYNSFQRSFPAEEHFPFCIERFPSCIDATWKSCRLEAHSNLIFHI